MANKNPAARVLIIDDHPLLRQGVAALITNEKDFIVCGEVSHAKQAVTEVEKTNPDVVLLDIGLQGVSGIEVLKDIKAQFPRVKVLMLSMHDESVYAPRALRAGALGYVMKSEVPDKLIAALRQVLRNKVYV